MNVSLVVAWRDEARCGSVGRRRPTTSTGRWPQAPRRVRGCYRGLNLAGEKEHRCDGSRVIHDSVTRLSTGRGRARQSAGRPRALEFLGRPIGSLASSPRGPPVSTRPPF
ncbi:hypothetical protein AAFF_G00344280 [Aldrovandia affinis]|uniref:Uncharacterized protein n=1 Tax=Aldrovandia affinis TaxID=143900 RepID=A0AAD7SK90_9TELE|nr:hypothetical protein AAFF_G00344280 [Aldrovandia affinis]